jgi:recombination protein RecA
MRDLRELFGQAAPRLVRLEEHAEAEDQGWGLEIMRGRVVELSGAHDAAGLTTAAELVLETQRAGEPVAWVALGDTLFYPQDLADNGIDLAALAVIRVPAPVAAVRAAEQLLRSGGFGLVVLDFGGGGDVAIPMGHLGRLGTLAQTHEAAVLCITKSKRDAPSLGSLISLRAEAIRRFGPDGDHTVAIRVLKDKRRGPGRHHELRRRGPSGY